MDTYSLKTKFMRDNCPLKLLWAETYSQQLGGDLHDACFKFKWAAGMPLLGKFYKLSRIGDRLWMKQAVRAWRVFHLKVLANWSLSNSDKVAFSPAVTEVYRQMAERALEKMPKASQRDTDMSMMARFWPVKFFDKKAMLRSRWMYFLRGEPLPHCHQSKYRRPETDETWEIIGMESFKYSWRQKESPIAFAVCREKNMIGWVDASDLFLRVKMLKQMEFC